MTRTWAARTELGAVPVALGQRQPLDEVDDELHLGGVCPVQIHPDHRVVVGDGDESVVRRDRRAEVAGEVAGRAHGISAGLLDVAAKTGIQWARLRPILAAPKLRLQAGPWLYHWPNSCMKARPAKLVWRQIALQCRGREARRLEGTEAVRLFTIRKR